VGLERNRVRGRVTYRQRLLELRPQLPDHLRHGGLGLGQDQLSSSEHGVALQQKVAGRLRGGGDVQGLVPEHMALQCQFFLWLQSGLHLAHGQSRSGALM